MAEGMRYLSNEESASAGFYARDVVCQPCSGQQQACLDGNQARLLRNSARNAAAANEPRQYDGSRHDGTMCSNKLPTWPRWCAASLQTLHLLLLLAACSCPVPFALLRHTSAAAPSEHV